MTKKCIQAAFKASIPVLFGYLSLGIAYGILLSGSGFPWWLATFSAVFIYAGSGQMLAVGLFAASTPVTIILLSELLLNIRHIVYGLSLITKFKGSKGWKPYLVFALTDETYSLLTTVEPPEDENPHWFYGLISLFDQCYWITGSTIGAIAGKLLPFNLEGVDFALTALFIVLTIEQIIKSKDIVPPLTGAAATLAAIILWKFNLLQSSNILIVSILVGIAAVFIIKSLSERRNKSL